ncbi:hypothetical protein SAMN05444157_2925 [Frankineae bacterium MT45]|nr:hypothetical protein SAMN05444157_2925 [Frankineae bacterium MT45]
MRKLPFSGVHLTAAVATVALLATGCSSDSKPPAPKTPTAVATPSVDTSGDAAYAKALDALSTSTAFHALAQGDAGSANPLKFDIHFGQTGSEATVQGTGLNLTLVSDGTNVYMKAPAALWASNLDSSVKNPAAKLALLSSKWVKIDTTLDAFSSYDIFTSKDKYIAKLKSQTTHYGLAGTQKVNGVTTTVLKGNNGSTWYVESTGKGRPVKTTGAGATTGGSTTIDQYDVPFSPQLPSASQVVDYKTVTAS